jgi:hypothetical protein
MSRSLVLQRLAPDRGAARPGFSKAIALAMIVGSLAGCEAIPGMERDAPAAPAAGTSAEELVYFAGEDRLGVYAEASGRSAVVGHLALHEEVRRSEVSRGYARIRTPDDRVSGWVDNAKLIWRLPEAAPASDESTNARSPPATESPDLPAAARAPQPPVAVDAAAGAGATETPASTATEAPAPEAPEPSTPPSSESPAERPEPSVFDPF